MKEEIDWEQTRENLEDLIKLYQNQDRNTDWVDEILNLKKTKNDLMKEFVKSILEWYALIKLAVEDEKFEICTLIKNLIEIEKENVIYIIDRYYGATTNKDIEKINYIIDKSYKLYFTEEK